MKLALPDKLYSVCLLSLMVSTVWISGCNTMSRSKTESVENHPRLIELERQLKRKQVLIETLKERNQILEHRVNRETGKASVALSPVPVPFTPSAAYDRSLDESPWVVPAEEAPSQRTSQLAPKSVRQSAPQSASMVVPRQLPEKTVTTQASGEHLLYSKVLESSRQGKLVELERAIELMLKTYRDSTFADNALYMAGLTAIEKDQFDLANKYFDRLLKEYPNSNKAVSAMFAQGVLEKRRGNYARAKSYMKRVRDGFPGSPEAMRTRLEMKIIDVEAEKQRESASDKQKSKSL